MHLNSREGARGRDIRNRIIVHNDAIENIAKGGLTRRRYEQGALIFDASLDVGLIGQLQNCVRLNNAGQNAVDSLNQTGGRVDDKRAARLDINNCIENLSVVEDQRRASVDSNDNHAAAERIVVERQSTAGDGQITRISDRAFISNGDAVYRGAARHRPVSPAPKRNLKGSVALNRQRAAGDQSAVAERQRREDINAVWSADIAVGDQESIERSASTSNLQFAVVLHGQRAGSI